MAAAPQIRGGRGGTQRRLASGCEQCAAGRVVQWSNTAWGQVSDNHRRTQHRSFAVFGKRVMTDLSTAARRCPRGAAMAAPGQARVAPQPLTAIDAAFTLAAPAARWQS